METAGKKFTAEQNIFRLFRRRKRFTKKRESACFFWRANVIELKTARARPHKMVPFSPGLASFGGFSSRLIDRSRRYYTIFRLWSKGAESAFYKKSPASKRRNVAK
jgi:hypothetical protein